MTKREHVIHMAPVAIMIALGSAVLVMAPPSTTVENRPPVVFENVVIEQPIEPHTITVSEIDWQARALAAERRLYCQNGDHSEGSACD